MSKPNRPPKTTPPPPPLVDLPAPAPAPVVGTPTKVRLVNNMSQALNVQVVITGQPPYLATISALSSILVPYQADGYGPDVKVKAARKLLYIRPCQ